MAVLGSMLLDNECAGDVLELVQPDYFYSDANRGIFQILIESFDARKSFDLVTLRNALVGRSLLDKVGGEAYLVGLIESVPSAANAVHYAGIVRHKAILRRLITASNEIQRTAYEDQRDAQEVLDRAEKLIFEVAEKETLGATCKINTLINEVFKRIDSLHDRKGRITGIPTGFYDLDDLTCGLQNSELIILAARPSVGKTTLALNIAERVAVENKMGVVIFSLEMSSQQLVQNMLCSRSRIDAQNIRKGFLSESDHVKLTTGAGVLFESPIFIDETPGLTTLQLRTRARRLKSQHDVKLIVVDYIQLLEADYYRRTDSRQEEISFISRGLKSLARELEVPILVISQLNRAVEGREDHKPRMSDLRESGALEQDADVVLLLHRSSYYSPEAEDSAADLIIAKQRNGPTGEIKLAFFPNYLRFENLAARQEPS